MPSAIKNQNIIPRISLYTLTHMDNDHPTRNMKIYFKMHIFFNTIKAKFFDLQTTYFYDIFYSKFCINLKYNK